MKHTTLFPLLLLSLALAGPAGAQGYRSVFEAYPPRVEEETAFTVTVAYTVPAGAAALHCELKSPEHVVLAGDTTRVTGGGKHVFTLRAPARASQKEVLVAAWLGEHWQQALAPIDTTAAIRILSHADQRREEAMRNDAAPALARLGYRRAPAGNAAVLDDDLPGLDRAAAGSVARALAGRGIAVSLLDARALANPYLLSREHFDMLVLPDARIFPAGALPALRAYLEAGGHLVALNGPAFGKLVWPVGGRWVDREGVLSALANVQERRPLLEFAGAPESWRRETNAPESPGSVAFETAGGRPCARFTIGNLTGWDTFAAPELAGAFPAGHTLTCFRARGDGPTSQLSVEWREKDGSRWIAVVPLGKEWRGYALPPSAFRYWHDSVSKGRGGPGDLFRPENASRVVLGLAFTHTQAVGGGRHEFWVADVASAPMPADVAGIYEALGGAPDLPAIEAISPAYKLYPVTNPRGMQVDRRQLLWNPQRLPAVRSTLAAHPRPQGTGFGKERRWRWVPLLEAINARGKPGGAAAALVINGRKPYEGGLWLSVPVTDPAFLRNPDTAAAVADAAARMLDGVFLFEGGTRHFAYPDGEDVEYGAEVANFGRRPATVEVEITIAPAQQGAPVTVERFPLTVAAGKREVVRGVWRPGRFAAEEYRVSVTLRRDGRPIDLLAHPLLVWRPAVRPSFVTAKAGDFWLDGRRWYPHGVNYMPSSGMGIEDGPYFEYWLDPQPYDPDVIQRDLEDVKAIGLNMVSVFIYHRSLQSHNLFDLLVRCRRLGLKVNLSLRPGTPMEFRWEEMKALIERHGLAQDDTVFAYDLAWEPRFGVYDARRRWDGDWEQWLVKRYGSLDAAEKAWGFPVPRSEGKVTGPSNQQVAHDGPWTKMSAAYRRFVDDLLHEKYAEARRLVRTVDPNHLVSFRKSEAGNPTCGQEGMPYDLKGLAGAVDLMCPEGYGRIGDWERVKPGWFTAAYARCVAPEAPVMWAEFGTSVWDESRGAQNPDALAFQGRFYRDFYKMVLRSGANGSVCWWFPGGYRCGERSDFGILNPDRTWRPATHAIHDTAARLTADRPLPRPDVWIPIRRDDHADGIAGVYASVKDAFWKAIAEGKTPGLRWE